MPVSQQQQADDLPAEHFEQPRGDQGVDQRREIKKGPNHRQPADKQQRSVRKAMNAVNFVEEAKEVPLARRSVRHTGVGQQAGKRRGETATNQEQ